MAEVNKNNKQLNKSGDRRGMHTNSRENLNPKGRGRPKLLLDYELIERLTSIHCTQEEIATALGVSVDTLQRNREFCGIYKKGIETAKVSLRRLQWRSAEGVEPKLVFDSFGQPFTDLKGKPIFTSGIPPNVTMQIWLGKQYLEQKDEQKIIGEGTIILKVVYDDSKQRVDSPS